MSNYDNTHELYHYGVKGMKWGVRRVRNREGISTTSGKRLTDKERARMDAKDLDYYRKNVVGFDLASARSKKKAGRQIDAMYKAWREYHTVSNGGKIDNEKTRALKKKYEHANIDMLNALISDVQLPSGRKPKWTIDANGQSKLMFETPNEYELARRARR